MGRVTHGVLVRLREAVHLVGPSPPPRLHLLVEGLGLPLAERQVKVRQQHMARVVQQDVLRLQVPVDEAHQVKVLQRQQHLPRTCPPSI